MALTFGSITSECQAVNSGNQLNAADRAYLEECRRNSDLLIDPNQLSVAYTNPYHAAFHKHQQQLLQQDSQLKRFSQKNRLRHFAILAVVLILLTLGVFVVAVFARDIGHGQYVNYFALLIGILIVISVIVLLATQVTRYFASRKCPKKSTSAAPAVASDE